jgi:hypothetical protein
MRQKSVQREENDNSLYKVFIISDLRAFFYKIAKTVFEVEIVNFQKKIHLAAFVLKNREIKSYIYSRS